MVSVPDRARYYIASHGGLIAGLLIVAGLFGLGYAGFVFVDPPTRTVTDEINEQRIETELGTTAVVTADTALYERGTRLQDAPIYYESTGPDVRLDLITRVPPDQEVTVEHRVSVQYTLTYEGEEFWTRSRNLTARNQTSRDGSARSLVDLNVSAIQDQRDRLASQTSGRGSLDVELVAITSYDTQRYDGRHRLTSSLSFGRDWFSIQNSETSSSHSQKRQRRITGHQDRSSYRDPAIAGLLTLVAGLVVGGVYWGLLGDLDPEAIEGRIARDRYAEWISTGRIGWEFREKQIEVETLKDLVDVGIDTNNRVIHDPGTNTYAVVQGDVVYRYDPDDPDDPTDPTDAIPAPGDDRGASTDDDGKSSGPDDDSDPSTSARIDE